MLPSTLNAVDFYQHFRPQTAAWLGAIVELCHAHSLPSHDIQAFTDGSNLVAGIAAMAVIKVFPPFHQHQWESEWRSLQRLGGETLSLPIPRLLAHGQRHDGWYYLIMSLLPGVTLDSCWASCSQQQKLQIMSQIGSIMAELHRLPLKELVDLAPDWSVFLAKQAEQAIARHRRLNTPQWLLDDLQGFIATHMPKLPHLPRVILTGEYTPFNLLVKGSDHDCHLTGMIDFGDVMIGHHEYDFLGPCLFLGAGDAELIASFLQGYGLSPRLWDEGLRQRLMLLAVLHRYSNLRLQIRLPDWETRVTSLDELAALIFLGRHKHLETEF